MGSVQGFHSYAVLGTGALGGLYGGLLAKAGADVHFLVRSDFETVRELGLQVESPLGDFHLKPVQCYARVEELPQVDVAIVAWKTTANEALESALQQVCRSDSLVLVLQNGWDVEREAAQIVGPDRVLGGCCFLCCNKVGPGIIKHLDYGRISFGEYGPSFRGKISDRMQRLEQEFRAANIDMRGAEDLRGVRWSKLAWNIPFNGLSVVLSADTSQIMNDPDAAELASQLMQEVRLSAAACGTDIQPSFIQKMLNDTRKMVPYDSSMRLDYRFKRPMEVEAIFGNPLRAAINAGYLPSQIQMLYQQLSYLDRTNQIHAP
jgi:2-dehydropantoate 2-reductase